MEAAMSNGTGGVGHTLIINNEDMERIKNAVVERVTEVLPGILVEVVPDIISRILPNIITAMEEKAKSHLEVKKEAERVMKENMTRFNEYSKQRKKFFQQHHRCECLMKLWDECLEEDYIPRKFRADKFHVNDRVELGIVNRRSEANFRCEHDILNKRKPEFANKVNEQDDVIFEFIENLAISGETRVEVSKLLKERTNADEVKVKQEWEKKIRGMKDAYQRDKETLDERNRSRFSDINVTIRRRTAASVNIEEDFIEDESDVETPEENEDELQSLDGSVIHGFTEDVSSGVQNDDDEAEGKVSFSDATNARVTDMANNFEHDDEESHFRDADHRTIPHDFFLDRTIPVQEQPIPRESTSPRS